MNEEELRALIGRGEDQRTEFKAAEADAADLARAIAALANSGGADLLLGIGDDGDLLGLWYTQPPHITRNIRTQPDLGGWRQLMDYSVREALANALAHRDWPPEGAKVRLFIFDDRMEIWSPGRLAPPITLERLAYDQFSRDQLIARVLVERGHAEEVGLASAACARRWPAWVYGGRSSARMASASSSPSSASRRAMARFCLPTRSGCCCRGRDQRTAIPRTRVRTRARDHRPQGVREPHGSGGADGYARSRRPPGQGLAGGRGGAAGERRIGCVRILMTIRPRRGAIMA